MLHLDALSMSVRAMSFGWPAFTSLTDVLVISNCLLSKATQDVMLVFKSLHPLMHVRQHFSLNF
jgi:hypothetical protein